MRGTRKVGPPVFFWFFVFMFALSQFSRPDYLGAWNRIIVIWKKIVRKTMIYFGLLISSYISENELIHTFNCFE